jgi:hypothetical protein
MAKTTDVAEKVTADAAANVAPRETPAIKVSAVKVDSTGFVFKIVFARLPADATAQDLNDHPEIWRHIQGNQHLALRQFDRVIVVPFDQSWIVEAVVSHADSTKAILAGIRKITLPQRDVPLYSDDMFAVAWLGSGYGVVRRRDGVQIGSVTHHSPELAKMELLRQYGSRPAA